MFPASTVRLPSLVKSPLSRAPRCRDGQTQIASACKLPRVWYAVAEGATATTATKGTKGLGRSHTGHARICCAARFCTMPYRDGHRDEARYQPLNPT